MFGKARKIQEAEALAASRRFAEVRAQRAEELSKLERDTVALGGQMITDNRGAGYFRALAISLDPAQLVFANIGDTEHPHPNGNGQDIWITTFTPEQVLAVAMEVDGHTTESMVSEKKHGLARAALGGLLFGGAGAVVGAATARTQTTGKQSTMHVAALRFAFDSSDRPSALIDFKTNLAACRDWYSRCVGFIEKGRRDSASTAMLPDPIQQIIELARLRESGAISDREFAALKETLIQP